MKEGCLRDIRERSTHQSTFRTGTDEDHMRSKLMEGITQSKRAKCTVQHIRALMRRGIIRTTSKYICSISLISQVRRVGFGKCIRLF